MTTSSRAGSSTRGFSLLEVMVAMSILATALMGVFALMHQTRMLKVAAEEEAAAMRAADRQFQMLSVMNLGTIFDPYDSTFNSECARRSKSAAGGGRKPRHPWPTVPRRLAGVNNSFS